MLFVSGLKDEIVPAEHMLQLFDAATSATDKVFHRVPDGMHNDTWLKGGEEYWTAKRSFFEGKTS